MEEAGTPTSPFGITEALSRPFNEVHVPECRPESNPRPEAWNPGVPNYPWWRLNFRATPPPVGSRICEIYLLAWIKEITRKHAEEWLSVETDRADLEKQLSALRKTQDRG